MISTLDKAAEFYKGAGEPTRLRMLGVLRHGELCVCDIMTVLALPQSTASRHLAYLRNSGWLESRRKKKWMYYRFRDTPQVAENVSQLLSHISSIPELQKDYEAMAQHLAKKQSDACDKS